MSALKGFRIVELAEGVGGEYCGKLLSDFGAEVIKVERPTSGSPTRAMAPASLFEYLNTNKQSVALDVAAKTADAALRGPLGLLSSADVVIDDHDVGWLKAVGLTPQEVERDYPRTIFCSITPYGLDAPPDRWNAKSLNVFHSSGWGYHTPSTFDPTRPPLKGPGRFLIDYEAAISAALCIVSSLYARQSSPKGRFIDISAQEVMVSRADIMIGRMLSGEDNASNSRAAFSQPGPHAVYPCRDGSVYLYMTNEKHWRGLRSLMGNPQWMCSFRDDWLEFAATEDAVATLRTGFAEWVKHLNRSDVSAGAQRLGVPLVPVNSAFDLHQSSQYAHRQFFRQLHHPALGDVLYPTVPYKLSRSPADLSTPAPRLGEYHATVREPSRSGEPGRALAPIARGGPLAGVRVLELTKVWAGPYAGKLLAFLGAEVIKVESHTNLDEMRAYGGADINHAPFFLSLNPEVLSVQVNLKSDKGLAILRELVANCDIVLDNLRPGAMERLGLAYDNLCAIKRDIIAVSIKMFGNDGPLGYQTGYAPCFAALGGLNYQVGYEGEPPLGINMRYGDATVGANAAFAAIVALLHRQRTGEGQFADLSAVECMTSMIGDSLFEYGLSGILPCPDGHAHADMAPHGVYPCAGDDWISIAIASDGQWQKLCEALGAEELSGKAQYRTLAGRRTDKLALDAFIGALTSKQDAKQLACRLRAAGVPACKSQNSYDVISDEDLWARGFFSFVSDAKEGSRPIVGAPWRISGTAATIARGAPLLGEHNAYVYGEILGYSEAQIQAMTLEEVIY